MTPEEFAKKIRDKYPGAYDSIDDVTLSQKVIAKYPVYKNQVVFDDTSGEEVFFGTAGGAVKEFGTGIKESFKKRTEAAAEQQIRPDIGLGRKAVRTLGEGAGFIGDIGFEALKAVTPQGVEELASKGVEKVAGTDTAQSLMNKVTELQQKYPEASKDLGALFNIAGLIPAGKGAQIAGKGVMEATPALAKGAKQLAEVGLEKGKMLAKDFKSSVKGYADTKALEAVEKDVDDLLKKTRSIQGKVEVANQKNINIKENLSDPNIFKGIKVVDKKIDPTEAVGLIESRVEKALDVKRKLLPEVDKYAPPVEKTSVRNKAIDWVKAQRLAPVEEQSVIKAIDRQLAPISDDMVPSVADDFRARFRKSSRDAKGQLKRNSEFAALENAFRDSVFESTDNLPYDTSGEFAALNDYIKNQIGTAEFLDKTLRGQVVKGGRLGSYSGRIVGAIAGSPGGIIGALAGAEIGGIITDIITNAQLGNSFKMRLIKNVTDDPEIIRQAEKLLKEAESYQPKELPAGSGEFRVKMESGAPIEMPKSGAVPYGIGDEPLSPEIKKTSTNPKTGDQYQKDLKTGETKYFPKNLNTEDSLIKEARKYKTAEEFVNSLMFHGTGESKISSILKEGLIGNRGRIGKYKGNQVKYVSFADDPNNALNFATGRGENAGMVITPKPSKIYDLGDIRTRNTNKSPEAIEWLNKFGTNEIYWGKPEAKKFLANKGYEAISFMNPDGIREIRILGDVKNVFNVPEGFLVATEKEWMGKPTKHFSINKSKLTDIWKKANKK